MRRVEPISVLVMARPVRLILAFILEMVDGHGESVDGVELCWIYIACIESIDSVSSLPSRLYQRTTTSTRIRDADFFSQALGAVFSCAKRKENVDGLVTVALTSRLK